jgi:hypothetical protein
VASAVGVTAYTSAINGKHYGVAAAIALAGLGLTVLATGVVSAAGTAAAWALPGLTELQDRMARRLGIDPIRKAAFQARNARGRVVVAVVFGLAALLDIGALLYALIH